MLISLSFDSGVTANFLLKKPEKMMNRSDVSVTYVVDQSATVETKRAHANTIGTTTTRWRVVLSASAPFTTSPAARKPTAWLVAGIRLAGWLRNIATTISRGL